MPESAHYIDFSEKILFGLPAGSLFEHFNGNYLHLIAILGVQFPWKQIVNTLRPLIVKNAITGEGGDFILRKTGVRRPFSMRPPQKLRHCDLIGREFAARRAFI